MTLITVKLTDPSKVEFLKFLQKLEPSKNWNNQLPPHLTVVPPYRISAQATLHALDLEALGQVLHAFPAFTVQLSGVDSWKDPQKERNVVRLKVKDESGQLVGLQQALFSALKPHCFESYLPVEPHLTISNYLSDEAAARLVAKLQQLEINLDLPVDLLTFYFQGYEE